MNGPPSTRYDPHAIEARRQAAWKARDAHATPPIDPESDRPRRYIKPSAPFTSGNVHIGHVRSYSIGDAYARYRRARGEDVLFAFGFDAFGLPAELGAIERGIPPAEWVKRCAEHMRGQLERIGYSLDWGRAFMSSDPRMYRWSQWLFVTLLREGLVYRGTGAVDWCDTCQTTLATIQVEKDGSCWRCHDPVRLIQRPEWYLRISPYLAEIDRKVGELAASGKWDEVALAAQRFVLGRVDGYELDLQTADGGRLTAFTPYADGAEHAKFVLISPRHPDVERYLDEEGRARLEDVRAGGLERDEREAEAIAVIETGHTAMANGDGALPVVVSPVVDGRYGPTAVLGVPALDPTDASIAIRIGMEVREGVGAGDGDGPGAAGAPVHADGALAQPGGNASETAPTGVVPRAAVRYRAGDFSVSRQRAWGTPIPIVHCAECGTVPVPEAQLPVVLPVDLRPTGTGNPLAEREDFVNTTCPGCDGPARRETDTLDCHFDALWLWVPVCVPPSERDRPLEEIMALEDLRAWLPCERVVAGSDSGNFVFDQRITTMALRDIGPLAFLSEGEPFAGCLFHEMVISDGRKMSKHLGNVVDPDELVERYGADTVRLATLYAARPQRTLNWSDSAVLRCHRFLGQVWELTVGHIAAAEAIAAAGAPAEEDDVKDKTEHLRVKLEQWCEIAVSKTTEDLDGLEMHTAVRNVMRLLDRIKDFEKRVRAREETPSPKNRAAMGAAIGVLAQVLSPFAPHIAEEMWVALGNDGDTQMPWPGVSSAVPA
jgi:leucyl-tRNA synthetase